MSGPEGRSPPFVYAHNRPAASLVAVVVVCAGANAQDSHYGIHDCGGFSPASTAGLLTTGPPVPVHPRLGVRLAYRLQRALRPHPGWRWLSARIEASGLARPLFTSAERQAKEALFGCRMCGQCALPVTGYVCPMGCPKELRNGPCGGVGADGSCEVYPELRCVWVDAYERAGSQGRTADLRLLHRPIDHRRWGQSSWLNYWQGRDEGLWVGDTDDDGDDLPGSDHGLG